MEQFNLTPLLPEVILAVSAMALLMVGVFAGNSATRAVTGLALAALLVTAAAVINVPWDQGAVLGGMAQVSSFSGVMKLFILLGLAGSLGLSVRYLQQENLERIEYPVLVLIAGIGMMLMVSAAHFLALYMALELQSLSLYVLAAFRRNGLRSSEAGVKYFTLGALSSGILLFGISLVYGAVGGLTFADVALVAGQAEPPLMLIIGMVFVISGIAFKISAVPFHMWTPDVYQGAPSSVTALFAIVPKVAAIGLIALLLTGPFYGLTQQWSQVLYVLSLLSMVVGGFAGLAQNNIKRLLAYSSIGNMGFALLGLLAASPAGVTASLLYVVIYMFMTAGVFALILSFRRDDQQVLEISDLAGFSKTHPLQAYAMAILMFSMSGIPPMAGFFGKLFVFEAALEAGYAVLAVIGVLSSVVAAYYYLRIIKVMFFDALDNALNKEFCWGRNIVLIVSIVFVMLFIIKPQGMVELMDMAAQSLFLPSVS